MRKRVMVAPWDESRRVITVRSSGKEIEKSHLRLSEKSLTHHSLSTNGDRLHSSLYAFTDSSVAISQLASIPQWTSDL